MRDLLTILVCLGIILICYLGLEIKKRNRYESYKVIELVLELVIVAVITLILWIARLWQE